ncbi:Uncharacterized conserved protein, DUF2267 family [Actinopolyspora mzabensis]|uniref:Uncharacterized conserved protein, DUF2267 family n=1 Tax=Actinopolyspora mzabensis TaxID=995066 RepID=A0A1G9EZ20_ACTMZ|nr:DUF2267 domain-containing protein [Actinopolyspora mzabensis]SDK81427.1 Uncharacterized conserved protein, DUF2267 family [Actinopolyspora mzabensis]
MAHPDSAAPTMAGFLEQIRHRAELPDGAEADRLARASLRALSERLAAGQLYDLAPALPPELREELHRFEGQAVAFEKETFLDQVSGEIDTVDLDVVERRVEAVFAVLLYWIPEEEIEDTVAQLPPDLAEMLRSAGE